MKLKINLVLNEKEKGVIPKHKILGENSLKLAEKEKVKSDQVLLNKEYLKNVRDGDGGMTAVVLKALLIAQVKVGH
jgi:hypothetical protein